MAMAMAMLGSSPSPYPYPPHGCLTTRSSASPPLKPRLQTDFSSPPHISRGFLSQRGCFYANSKSTTLSIEGGNGSNVSDKNEGKCNISFRGLMKKNKWCINALLVSLINFPSVVSFTGSAHAESKGLDLNVVYSDIASLEISAQLLYLATLLGLVGVGTFFVVRQVLVQRELESAAKSLQDRVRTGEALPVEYFELGAIMLRKKFFVLSTKYLQQAIEKWDGDPQDLAQVHNALGFSLFNDGKVDRSIAEYEKAVKLQPGYVTAWNNLASAYEKKKNLPKALKAYEQALFFDPNNSIAKEYGDAVKAKLERLAGVPVKYDD